MSYWRTEKESFELWNSMLTHKFFSVMLWTYILFILVPWLLCKLAIRKWIMSYLMPNELGIRYLRRAISEYNPTIMIFVLWIEAVKFWPLLKSIRSKLTILWSHWPAFNFRQTWFQPPLPLLSVIYAFIPQNIWYLEDNIQL